MLLTMSNFNYFDPDAGKSPKFVILYQNSDIAYKSWILQPQSFFVVNFYAKIERFFRIVENHDF